MDADKARFRAGFPEKIGGWVKATTETFTGVCRSLFTWVTLSDRILTAVGATSKYYIENSGLLSDITPIDRSATLGANPLQSVSAGSGVIIVTHATHGASVGDYVIVSGATAFDGLTVGDLNQEMIITQVDNVNTYRVDTGGVATAGATSGGGGAVNIDYLLPSGSESSVYGAGWGAGAWSRSTWSSASTSTTLASALRRWSQSNWGEDLIFAPRYGAIYWYDSSVGTRATLLSDEVGASDVPLVTTEILVSTKERIAVALGCNEIGSSVHDHMFVRWSDYENNLDWTPSTTSAAGGFRLTHGSAIVTALESPGEIAIWTDTALYMMPFVGQSDNIFNLQLVSGNSTIAGPTAKTSYLGVLFWMGHRGFYAYDGRVSRLPCTVEDFVFTNISQANIDKTVCGSNGRFNEIWWHYAEEGYDEPNRYVALNVSDGTWTIGTLSRTAWIDRSLGNNYPRAAAQDGYIYTHEYGLDDGSTDPSTAILSYVESAPVEIGPTDEIGRGDRISFVNRLIPDITFRSSTNAAPTMTYVFKERSYPGVAYSSESSSVLGGATVDQYTGKKSIRLRARAIAMRVENEEVGTDWRLGTQRVETRTDGRK